MIRKIIQIDSKKCNGCGACATACHEGAIAMVDGKAVFPSDPYLQLRLAEQAVFGFAVKNGNGGGLCAGIKA